MAVSLSLLNPLPKAAKFINYTDFDIVPIVSTEAISLPLRSGDRMHVAPPAEMYLIDGNNNAYKNILPPADDFQGEPNIIQARGQYQVYENLQNTLIYPTISSGWRLDYFPPTPPPPPSPEEINKKDNSTMIFWIIMFISLIFIVIIISIYNYNRDIWGAYQPIYREQVLRGLKSY